MAPIISPEQRTKLHRLFEYGNQQMMKAGFDAAHEMFVQCVQGDPGNVLYAQSFMGNLRKKFGERKKKGVFGMLSGAGTSVGLKKAEMQKNWEQVIKSGLENVKSDPWDASTLALLGTACAQLECVDAAIVWLKFAIESETNDIEVNRSAGRVFRAAEKLDEASGCWLRILKLKPDDNEALKAKRDIDVERTILKGKYAKKSEDESESEKLERIHADAPREDQDAMGRTLTYEEQIERRIKKNPSDIANYLEYAQHCYQTAEYEKCEENYRKAVEVSNNSPDMIERLLDAQKQNLLAKVMKCKEDFEQHKTAELRDAFYQTKELYDAKIMELAQHRVQYSPTSTSYRFELATILQQRGEYKEAIAEFQKARGDVQRKGECLLALGQCFQQIKQYKLALSHYEEAVTAITEVNDAKKKALYLLTKLAIGLSDWDKADRYAHELAAADFSYKDIGGLLDKIAASRDNPAPSVGSDEY